MRRATCLLVAVSISLTVVGAACSSEEASVEVRSFDEVRASPITFEPDPGDPTRAVLRVTTTEPMICAIVWGEDDGFGRFNNSLSMNGTGITQHDVVLPDVEPGVTYRYVIQGTTADGTLYRSEVASFTLEPGTTSTTAPVDRGEDLARGSTVAGASSEFSEAFAATNALDGDTSTEWATRADGDDGFIVVDLGAVRDIGGVEFLTRSMADGSAITDTYTVAIDDQPPLGPFTAGTVADPRFAALAATGRLVRFEVATSTGGNVGAVEIRIYGPQR